MQIHAPRELLLAPLPGKINPPECSLTLIVKGTFRLAPDQAAMYCDDDQRMPVSGDEFVECETGQSLRYDSDFAYFKPRADAMLVGTCHTPNGAPLLRCRVSFGVGEHLASLLVVGDRQRAPYLKLGHRQSAPQPFTAMPLGYERSFGGAGYAPNPVGKGKRRAAVFGGAALPNILPTSGKKELAGFGPLPCTWPQRNGKTGTYRAAYLKERWPWFPEDFDWGYFNAAPPGQQIDGYLRGDEALYFEHLHPKHPEYRAVLPGLRARCFVNEGEDRIEKFREVPLQLDTLWVDMDRELLVLVWRGHTPVATLDFEEIQHAFLVTEALTDAPRAAADYEQQLVQMIRAPVETPPPAVVSPAPEPSPQQQPAPEREVDAETQAHIEKALELGRQATASLGLPPELFDAVANGTQPADVLLQPVKARAGVNSVSAEQSINAAHEKVAQVLQDAGYDGAEYMALVNAPPESEPPAAAAPPPASEARGYAGTDMTGADLAGQDLTGADFHGAVLTNANLRGCKLSGANFNAANLAGVDLTGAVLSGADLNGADLHAARLEDADLDSAKLTDVDLADAKLARANLRSADATRARLRNADLDHACVAKATLDSACLDGARLDGADFSQAVLRQASLRGAKGEGARFVAADLGSIKGAGCTLPQGDFRDCRGSDAIFRGADLHGADFGGAQMAGSVFAKATLSGARLNRADFRKGDFARADLRLAQAAQTNLFRATFERADLSGADCSGSNLYEAEFLDAVIDGARFEGANLTMTKLAHRKVA